MGFTIFMTYFLVFLFGVFIGNGFLILGIDTIDKYIIQKMKIYFINKKKEKEDIKKMEQDKNYIDEYVEVLRGNK